MKGFAALYTSLDQTTEDGARIDALAAYFRTAPKPDRLWAIALLSGQRPRRVVTMATLRNWAQEQAGLPDWLFEASRTIAGDQSDAIALILPEPVAPIDKPVSDWIAMQRGLETVDEAERKQAITRAWSGLSAPERVVLNKLLTGGWRMTISQSLITRALSQATGIDGAALALRLSGDWSPDDETWESLIEAPNPGADISRPYPFRIGQEIKGISPEPGDVTDWIIERKWIGMRAQMVLRGGQMHLWSLQGSLVTDRFPELAPLVDFLPGGTVIEGVLLAYDTGREHPLPAHHLAPRNGSKPLTKRHLAEVSCVLMAYDLLEWRGEDIRAQALAGRRGHLERALAALSPDLPIRLSPRIEADGWETLAQMRAGSRAFGTDGLVLKQASAPYQTDKWWVWKAAPLTIDAVLIYAEAGSGGRAADTEFTFAVRDGNGFVPVTKTSAGLADAEIAELADWVRQNTLEKFGPVRSVTPTHVFEIGFDRIGPAPRRKSGVLLHASRVVQWQRGKSVDKAQTLADLKSLLAEYE